MFLTMKKLRELRKYYFAELCGFSEGFTDSKLKRQKRRLLLS